MARRREAVDPREQELLDRRRDLNRDVVVEAVAARLADERHLGASRPAPRGEGFPSAWPSARRRPRSVSAHERRAARSPRRPPAAGARARVRCGCSRAPARAGARMRGRARPLGDHGRMASSARHQELLAQLHRGRVRPVQVPSATTTGRSAASGAARSRRPRRSGTGAPPGRLGQMRGVRLERQPRRAPGAGRSRRRVPGRVRRRCAAARPQPLGPSRPAPSPPAAGRGTADREAIRREPAAPEPGGRPGLLRLRRAMHLGEQAALPIPPRR